MRLRTFAVGLTLVLALLFGQVPTARAQEPPDVTAGNIVGEMIELLDFDPTSPTGWTNAFTNAFEETGEYETAMRYASLAINQKPVDVTIAKGSTPTNGSSIVDLDDGTMMWFIWAVGSNPPTPTSPSTVYVTYIFPDGTVVVVEIIDKGNGPVVTFTSG